MGGYGAGAHPARTSFPSTSNIILLGTPKNPTTANPTQAHNQQYYMDFEEPPNGNQNDVLDLAALTADRTTCSRMGRRGSSRRRNTSRPIRTTRPSVTAMISGGNKSYRFPKVGNGGKGN